jgi:alcohol dehydrogenase (cytochrome c)
MWRMMDRTGRAARPAGAALLLAMLLGSVAHAADYAPVIDERLAKPEPQNWLQWRGNYGGWGYSPLDQVTADNAKDLVPVWLLSTGVLEGHQAPPMVNNGLMFVSTPEN